MTSIFFVFLTRGVLACWPVELDRENEAVVGSIPVIIKSSLITIL